MDALKLKLTGIKEYFIFLYYRLGRKTGAIFFVSNLVNLILIAIIIILFTLYSDYRDKIPIFLEETVEEKAEDTSFSLESEDLCVVDPYYLSEDANQVGLFPQDNVGAETSIDDTENQSKLPKIKIPEEELLPLKVQQKTRFKNPLSLITLRIAATELIYSSKEGESPSLKSLVRQYQIRARNFRNTRDSLWEAHSLIKVANIQLLLGENTSASFYRKRSRSSN